MKTFYARKEGMTSISRDDKLIPVTVLSVLKAFVLDEKTDKAGTVRVALPGIGRRPSKPVLGTLNKSGAVLERGRAIIRNIFAEAQPGADLDFSFLSSVKSVNVAATSIGKGFQGAMKRHNFGGLRASHGVSISHRSHGSTGGRQDPGKVFKNKKMAGHMGAERVTVKNLDVVAYDAEQQLLFVKGSVPGPKSSLAEVRVV